MRQKIHLNLKLFLAASPLFLNSCNQPIPKWDGKLWAGSSADAAIERAQTKEVMKCAEATFDDYVCMSSADLQKFYETYILGCKQWFKGIPMMTPSDGLKKIQEINR